MDVKVDSHLELTKFKVHGDGIIDGALEDLLTIALNLLHKLVNKKINEVQEEATMENASN